MSKKHVEKPKKEEAVLLKPSITTLQAMQLSQAKQSALQGLSQIALLQDLVAQLDPDHTYTFSAQLGAFVQTKKEDK
jgi:hypothetical protein